MGVSDESAILSKWLVREGDRIHRGQPVFSLETDKATFQHEAESDGILVRILTGEGEEAAVGSPVGILSDVDGKFTDSDIEILLRDSVNEEDAPQVGIKTEDRDKPGTASEPDESRILPQNKADAERRISPRARKRANELGVDLKTIRRGSGPQGRILERDILKAVRTAFHSEPERKTTGIHPGRPLTQADRIVARGIEAKTATEQAGFVSRVFDARSILALCTPQNGYLPGMVVCYELAHLLAEKHELNARRHIDRIYEYGTVHLRLTVETPFGTLKPVIRCAETYTLNELSVLMRNAASRCRRFASKPQEFQDGTFTVADLSGYGADFFMPELTPPELCALGIGTVSMQPGGDKQGKTEVYPAIRLTLVYDRAGIDALRAAKSLNELASRLEHGWTQQ